MTCDKFSLIIQCFINRRSLIVQICICFPNIDSWNTHIWNSWDDKIPVYRGFACRTTGTLTHQYSNLIKEKCGACECRITSIDQLVYSNVNLCVMNNKYSIHKFTVGNVRFLEQHCSSRYMSDYQRKTPLLILQFTMGGLSNNINTVTSWKTCTKLGEEKV